MFEGRVRSFIYSLLHFCFRVPLHLGCVQGLRKTANIYEGSTPSLLFVHWANDLPIELNRVPAGVSGYQRGSAGTSGGQRVPAGVSG